MENNLWSDLSAGFVQSLRTVLENFVEFTPRLIVAVVFFIVGWLLGSLIARAIEQVFNSLKVDGMFASIGADSFLRRAGMNLNIGYFIGQVVRWFIIIVFLLPSLNIVGLYDVSSFLQDDVLGYLPRVVIAALVLIIAAFISEFLSKAVMASGKAMNLRAANMLGALAKYAVWLFAFIIALGTLGVAEYYMGVLFTGIILMFSLGGALAFGLGGKEHASRLISSLSEEVSEK